jgi:predicted O-methyltransferase YrrM
MERDVMETLIAELQALSRYSNLVSQFESIRGFLLPLEGYALMKLAAQGSGIGAIVEIGSYMGRSTCWLATGSKSVFREKVVAVDHFTGSPEHQAGAACAEPALATEGSTFPEFQRNIQKAGLADYVTPIRKPSEEAAKEWNGPIRLLFIDGDHSYESVSRDFALWSPFVVQGGLICLHDVNSSPDVTRFYQDLCQHEPSVEAVMVAASLAVLRKRL